MYQNLNYARIISKILNIELNQVIFEKISLSEQQKDIIQSLIAQYDEGFPLDYILGQIIFCNYEFVINRNVLIPRPETEFWIKKLAAYLKTTNFATFDLVDVGAGCGIIGLTLSAHFQKTHLLDISPLALEVCQQNSEAFNNIKLEIVESNLLENLKIKNCDWLLVTNLPYVPLSDKTDVKINNISFEPALAIFSGEDGLDLFRELLNQLTNKFPNCLPLEMYFELDPRNIKIAAKIAAKKFPQYNITTWLDENDLERVLVLRR